MSREDLLNEIGEAMKHFKDKKIEKEKGPMFTFAMGKQKDGSTFAMVVVLKGKQKIKAKKVKGGVRTFNHYIEHKDFVTVITENGFKLLFGRELKPGKVYHGRLKLRIIKRKKKC